MLNKMLNKQNDQYNLAHLVSYKMEWPPGLENTSTSKNENV